LSISNLIRIDISNEKVINSLKIILKFIQLVIIENDNQLDKFFKSYFAWNKIIEIMKINRI